jgi:cell division protein FtsZ
LITKKEGQLMQSAHSEIKGPFTPKITVIGVGGGGGNAVNNMIASKLSGVQFLACNTDVQALENSLADTIIQLGDEATGGLGAGARPEIGRVAAEESLEELNAKLDGVNMVFITAGMGGGTGTGAAPVIARLAKEKGILTVGVVTKPFQFEGAQRMRMAEEGIDELAQYVDTLIVIPNQNLFRIANEKTTFSEAFCLADNVLQSGVRGVTDLMVVPGMINLDFADVRSATSEMGKAMMGTGEASGDRRAIEAAEQAINNPLLDDVSMKGARSVIINIAGGHDLTLFEIEEACNRINDEVDPDATIIFGSTHDDSLEGSMRITVVATGIEAEINRRAASKPMRPINTAPYKPQVQQDVSEKKVQETPVTDGFSTRYPEPSRVQASHSAPVEARSVSAQSLQNIEHVEPQQQAVAYKTDVQADAPVVNTNVVEPSVEEVGYAEPNYVQEGSAVRKIAQNMDINEGQGLIPPHAPRSEHVSPSSSMTLNPPVQPQVQQNAFEQPKKTPSLFERITGARSRFTGDTTEVEVSESEGTGSGSTTSAGGNFPPLTAPRKVVSAYDEPVEKGQQGSLNIESPKALEKTSVQASGENLDIPAFLRRQIS